jgi:ribosomal protein S27AE
MGTKHYDNTVRIICIDCPRCGGTIITYQLDDQESYVCDECEYVGIDVDHGATSEEVESWDKAMIRFYERGSGGGESDGATSGEHGIGTGSEWQQPSLMKRVSRNEGENEGKHDKEFTPAIVRAGSDGDSP